MIHKWHLRIVGVVAIGLTALLSSGVFAQHTSAQSDAAYIQFSSQCKPTCWLGIVPGMTSVSDAEGILRSHHLISDTQKLVNLGRYGPYPDLADDIHGFPINMFEDVQFVDVGIILSGTIVSEIGIEGRTSSLEPKYLQKFREQWSDFAPEVMVTKLGVPSGVWLMTYAMGVDATQIPNHFAYDMWIAYEDRGVLVHYVGLSKITKRGQAYWA